MTQETLTTDERLGRVVRERREAIGLTQAEVSDALASEGVSVSSTALAKAEAGTRAVKVSEAVALAKVLSLHIDLLDLTEEADDLAGMLARSRAEAASAARAAAAAAAEAERHEQRAEALDVLSRARTERVQWRGDKADLLERAFGADPATARTGLLALGLTPDTLDRMERDHASGTTVQRTDWRSVYSGLRLARLLPNLQIVKRGAANG